MKIYNYDEYSGKYIRESLADESPLEPETFLIPANATEIEPPKMEGSEAYYIDGNWVLKSIVIKEYTLPDLKLSKKAQINGAFSQNMQMITSGYPQDEIASWGKQEQEARAFVADAESATPLIGALAEARGVAKPDLAGRIIYKADAYAQISGQLIGKRQALEDAIDAAETTEALEPISW